MEDNKNAIWIIIFVGIIFVMLIGAITSSSLKFGPRRSPGNAFDPAEYGRIAPPTSPTKRATSTKPSKTVVKKIPMKLVSPNGGEVWERAKQYNVRWNTDLAVSVPIVAVLFPAKKAIVDPYAVSPGAIAGVEMFTHATLSHGFNDGSYSYRVPDTIAPGTYQVILWGGTRCGPAYATKPCQYDLSDGLLTIK